MVEPRPQVFAIDPAWVWSEGFVWMPDLVYALQPLRYHDMYRLLGEVFQMQDFIDRKPYLAAGVVESLPRDATPVFLRALYRVFLNRVYSQAYAQRYATRDVSGLVFWEPERATSTGTRAPLSRGRPPGSGLIYPQLELLIRLLEPAVLKFRSDTGRWPTRQEAIKLVEWPDRTPSVDNLADRFRQAGTAYREWLKSLETTPDA